MKQANVFDDDDDDARARESAEQEDVCVLLSRFYEVVRPEEQKVSCFKKGPGFNCVKVIVDLISGC